MSKLLRFGLCLLLILFALIACAIAVFGSGQLLEATNTFFFGGYKRIFLPILVFLLFFSVCCFSKVSYWLLGLPILVIMCLYFPIGFTFGVPNAGQVASALNTDPGEAREFLSVVSFKYYFVPFVGIILGVSSYLLAKKFDVKWWESKVYLFLLVTLITLQLGLLEPLRLGGKYIKESIAGSQQLKSIASIESKWNVLSVDPKYQIYVLVMGESARRDYMHAYGYPVDNTPFMNNRGVLVNGLLSNADYTIQSIQKSFTKTNAEHKEVNFEYNLIDLLNKAGFDTYWLSNQGKINKKDTPITAIANRSKHTYWVKEYLDRDANTSDLALLEKFKESINDSDGNKKFIVLHLMGSHSAVCERVQDQPLLTGVKDPKYKEPNCYVTTVKQTDNFLKEVDDLLKNTGKSYSVIVMYVSDHGISHHEQAGKIIMNHADPAAHHRDIPLFVYSSDDKPNEQIKVNATKFLKNMTEGVAEWIGVKTEGMTSPRSLLSNEDQADEENVINTLAERRSDPVIDIRLH